MPAVQFALTDSSLIERRPVVTKSTKDRIRDSGKQIKPTKNPGILRRRDTTTPGGAC